MKSLKIASILLLTIVSLSTFSAVSAANTVFEEKQINVNVNETFPIELADISGSTGYCWKTEYDSTFVNLVDEKIVKKIKDPYFIGGYNKTYTFKAKKPGQTKITMTQSRPWSNEMPAKIITYIINIK